MPVNIPFQILYGSYHSSRIGKYLLSDVHESRIGIYIIFSDHRSTFVLDHEYFFLQFLKVVEAGKLVYSFWDQILTLS